MSSQLCNESEGQDKCGRIDKQNYIMKSRVYGDIVKTVIQQGEGQLKPNWESQCTLDINIEGSGIFIENENKLSNQCGENIVLTLGQSDSEFMRIVETYLMTMKKGEVSKFSSDVSESESVVPTSINDLPTKEEGQEPQIQNKREITIKISLHSFSQAPPLWKLSSDEKYNLALSYKTQGTELFQAGNIDAAFRRYSRAVRYLICIPELSTVSDSEFGPPALTDECAVSLKDLRALQCMCYLNLAACQAKVSNHLGVINNCTRALAIDASSVKALYRRAVANIACGHKEKAR